MLHSERLKRLNDAPERSAGDRDGGYVLYWMQQAQRVRSNHALEHAIERANALGLPVIVGFGLMDDYPEATRRHYAFMLEGLAEVAADLEARGIRFVMRRGAPDQVAIGLAERAALVVCDRGYLRHQMRWREAVAEAAGCRVEQVESDVVVPIEVASDKAEHAARTIRPKIERHRETFLVELDPRPVEHPSLELDIESELDATDPDATLDQLKLDDAVDRVARFKGGASEARRRLDAFIAEKLDGYADGRNEPVARQCSELSPYLHFGQISPLDLALAAKAAKGIGKEDRASFLEELIVRRELAMNFVAFTENYDAFEAMPGWARKTMAEHSNDEREHTYTEKQLAAGETHDRLLERGDARDARLRLHAQLHADVLGQEDHRVVQVARGRLRHDAAAQQPLLPRRPGSRLLRQCRLALRPARPRLDRAAGVRQAALHERQGPRAEIRHRGLCGVDRDAVAACSRMWVRCPRPA